VLIDIIRSMRPRQWPKNAFVFVALLFDRKLFDLASLLPVLGTFVLLCLLSGAVYLMNDLADIAAKKLGMSRRTEAAVFAARLSERRDREHRG